MQEKLLALSFGLAAMIFAAQAAHAEAPFCAARAEVVAQLASQYEESRRSIGVAANNAVVELYASEQGTWTILATMPDGTACLIASGESFEALNEALPAIGEPA